MKRIAIIGGGIAGVTAAWQLSRLAAEGADLEATLFEASPRLGGIVETVREAGFIVECGPDAWVTEKPWARELAEELGLGDEIIPSNDSTRKTYIMQHGKLVAMPDGMRMMVPADVDALDRSNLFSEVAKSAFRAETTMAVELKAVAPEHDESVASFVQRHFGTEVLDKIGAPLLSGVFGGDVTRLSVRAVMAPFVAMERAHGSLILALQQRLRESAPQPQIFTTLKSGTSSLIEKMVAQLPCNWVKLENTVRAIKKSSTGWQIETASGSNRFDALLLATPVDVARNLLRPTDPTAADLMQMETSSAVIAAFGFQAPLELPAGFGFLVPPGSSGSRLLAATFADQKFDGRAPAGSRLIRAFFGGATADSLLNTSDEDIASLAMEELQQILGPLPDPVLTVVRRWPRALPQYAVGHLERMAELHQRVRSDQNLWLLGNGYRGVGLPDLIREARSAAREVAAHPATVR